MKKIYPLLVITLLSSCSFLSRRGISESEEQKRPEVGEELVSKSQFDQLTLKYESLLKRNEELEERLKVVASGPSKAIDDSISPENLAATIRETQLADTVDPLAPSTESGVVATSNSDGLDSDRFNDELSNLRKAQKLLAEAKYDQSLKILKELEGTKHKQIRVRAKFYIGELLFRQQEYDLALQVFEEVISKEAYSGLVLKSLGRLIVCAEKLKLADKHERYHTLMQTFFEEG